MDPHFKAFLIATGILILVGILRAFLPRLPKCALTWCSALLGAATSVAEALMSGQSWPFALMRGIETGLIASGLYAGGAKFAVKPAVKAAQRKLNGGEAPPGGL